MKEKKNLTGVGLNGFCYKEVLYPMNRKSSSSSSLPLSRIGLTVQNALNSAAVQPQPSNNYFNILLLCILDSFSLWKESCRGPFKLFYW